ncbi:squalene/phytoene synthase family protein [Varunaivibrio sulfuroxidans]|uniref:Phytoene/squalene synthetase n=1 Tax=Varunaivibrio sulfuroxidans TaxID=1773489 RepID=A0A4R3J7H4_9PROT|nr:squalene/phytoene synthase family protein [Varunaivibrio sulfuroxidans]TCS61362.1 phytoene/squalene synthetase [Varunaivibrio sulfuroxidans]WES31026.1 squalene/phytoene synthase family protein [Varunaivibrio sulfuroxidans]
MHRARRGENFPVASMLLPAHARRSAHAFYALARFGDDIADCARLNDREKRARLHALKSQVCGDGGETSDPARMYAKELDRALVRLNLAQGRVGAPIDVSYVRALLETLIDAFLQDVRCDRYQTWDDLMQYCRLSAVPVGRFLVALTGGVKSGGVVGARDVSPELRATDALSMALQILNHVQDLRADYRTLGRVYLPQCWIDAEGARREELAETEMTRAMTRVKVRMLDGADALLCMADGVGRNYVSARLKLEARGIHAIARALSRRLRHADPLARRVALSRLSTVKHFALGIMRGAPDRNTPGQGLKQEDFRRY